MADLWDEEGVVAVVEEVLTAHGRIDGLVNNADVGAPTMWPGWWDIRPPEHGATFDGFHRAAAPVILGGGPAGRPAP